MALGFSNIFGSIRMLAGTSLQPPSRSMWLTMYTADTSPTESTHSALVKTQMRHNLQSSHNKDTEKQLQKLTSSIKFHNYRNEFVTNNNEVEEPNLMLPWDTVVVLF